MNEVSAGFARGGAATTAALASMPADLRRAVFIAGNGEVAWPVYRAVDAAFWLTAHGSALVAGELYQRLPESYWGTFVDEWTMAPGRLAGELWATYVQRSLGQARGQIEAWMANATNESKVCLIVESEPCVAVNQAVLPAAQAELGRVPIPMPRHRSRRTSVVPTMSTARCEPCGLGEAPSTAQG